jgi:hypothetical protein
MTQGILYSDLSGASRLELREWESPSLHLVQCASRVLVAVYARRQIPAGRHRRPEKVALSWSR